jgi:hypothetical protein
MALQQSQHHHKQAPSAFKTREECIQQLSKLNDDSLRMLAELSTVSGVEEKLKKKFSLIKLMI